MIETTVKYVDGCCFIDKVRLVPPYERRYGVHIEYITKRLSPHHGVAQYLSLLGFRQVGFDITRNALIYTRFPVSWLWYKIVDIAFNLYWKVIWWLYDNCRLFKQVPSGEQFSWRYFTPYTWFTSLRRRLYRETPKPGLP